MRKNITYIFFFVYVLIMLTAAWWSFDFRFSNRAGFYVEPFQPFQMRYRWLLEKDILKLSMFIPVGIFLVILPGWSAVWWKKIMRAVFIGAVLSAVMQTGRYFLPGRSVGLTDLVMNVGGTFLGASVLCFQFLSRRLLAWLMGACIGCFVLAATFPCKFSLQAASFSALAGRVEFFPMSGMFSLGVLRERALNGFMMMPLGLLAATYALRNPDVRRVLVFTTLVGFCSSLAVEVLQCFLAYRTPSFSDLSLNTAGTFIGGAVAVYLHRCWKAEAKPQLS